MLYQKLTRRKIFNLKSDPGSGDYLAGRSVLFYYINKCFKGGVVYNIAVRLAVRVYEYIKRPYKLRTRCAGYLFYCINSVGQRLCFGKPVFIRFQPVPLRFL